MKAKLEIECQGSLPESYFVCPGQGHSGINDSYVYIDWSRWRTLDEINEANDGEAMFNYPLLYDKSLSNHGGRGINVVTLNLSAFWDENASWLRKFAENHPQVEIPMPKGIELVERSEER